MNKTYWTEAARAELRAAAQFIANDSTHDARNVLSRLRSAAEVLADTPTGRIGRCLGTFEKVVPPTSYGLVYAVDKAGDVTILQLIHMARQRAD